MAETASETLARSDGARRTPTGDGSRETSRDVSGPDGSGSDGSGHDGRDANRESGHELGPRALLRRLREAMAENLSGQEQLDSIVREIAANLHAEVCSVYVLRDDDVLELYGNVGFNPDAVHLASLKVGEGLVGTIAETGRILNLEDAHEHPAFAYLPETGEEAYHAFLGVPMRRAGRALGVVVVQNRSRQAYREVDVEAVETAAMVLCDLVAAGRLDGMSPTGRSLDLQRPHRADGARLAGGIGVGRVFLHEPRVVIRNLFHDDAEGELRRLRDGIEALRESVDHLVERRDVGHDGDHREVLESYRMFAHDRGWLERMEGAIRDGLTAEAAVEKIKQENRARLGAAADPYLRERIHDFDDLSRRLHRLLTGYGLDGDALPEATVLVARTMGAAELLDYDRDRLAGLAIEEAAPTSHVVIVARALGLPVVGQLRGIVQRAENGDEAICDGDTGRVFLRPPAEVRDHYVERVALAGQRREHFAALSGKPAVSRDGVPVELMLNAGLLMDLPHLTASGASGVGLFRTELQFMIANSLPRVDEQERFYRRVLDAAGDKPVIFRTLDVGGDKVLPYLKRIEEENPALGWRSIRLSIDRPGLLRIQLRAMLRAAAGRRLCVMLPMVTEAREIDRVREILDAEIALHERFGYEPPTAIDLGSMIEVPSLLWQLDELMGKVDFVSVGSNDLFQFMVASDRTNAHMADRYQPLSRPFLRALREIVRAGRRNETAVHLCGELGGDPLAAMAMIALGYRHVSMPAAAMGPVKEMLLSLDVGAAGAFMDEMLAERAGDGVPLGAALASWAGEHGVIM